MRPVPRRSARRRSQTLREKRSLVEWAAPSGTAAIPGIDSSFDAQPNPENHAVDLAGMRRRQLIQPARRITDLPGQGSLRNDPAPHLVSDQNDLAPGTRCRANQFAAFLVLILSASDHD